jgi:hypothetical protein
MNKRKKFILSKWRPSFTEMVRKVMRKRSAKIAANVTKNNALFKRIQELR